MQTLHPTKMDGGQILAQTPFPGHAIPSPNTIEEPQLRSLTGELGAKMLVKVLRENKFEPPVQDLTPLATKALKEQGRSPRHASKLGIKARHIDWSSWTSDRILRASRFLGPLWNEMLVNSAGHYTAPLSSNLKLVFSGGFEVAPTIVRDGSLGKGRRQPEVKPGFPYVFADGNVWFINTVDRKTLYIKHLTVSGAVKLEIPRAMTRLNLMDGAHWEENDGCNYFIAQNPFT